MLELQDAQVQAEAEQTEALGKVPRVIPNPFGMQFQRGQGLLQDGIWENFTPTSPLSLGLGAGEDS